MLKIATQHGIRPWYVTGGRIVVSPYNSCDLGGLGPPFFLASNAYTLGGQLYSDRFPHTLDVRLRI